MVSDRTRVRLPGLDFEQATAFYRRFLGVCVCVLGLPEAGFVCWCSVLLPDFELEEERRFFFFACVFGGNGFGFPVLPAT